METREIRIVYGERELYLPIDNILLVKAEDNYCDVYMNNSVFNLRSPLGKFWVEIETQGKDYPHHLKRISRSYIINLDYLTKVDPIEGSITLYKPDSPILNKISSMPNNELKVNVGKMPTKELVKFLDKNKE